MSFVASVERKRARILVLTQKMLKIARVSYSKLNIIIISIDKNLHFLTKVGHRLDSIWWVRTKCTFFNLEVSRPSIHIISTLRN
ncbi:hypothetical protein B9Z55_023101 [Caenorhabditis nigoni]|uniref:Uncharacterized protein n=1 Tax=Caenorhabditis nigoni TaxID=1611254 RepID=A0A2G5SNP7_9PELO|nr:hypothetical protein B9Z55_023101 [Caenorhabditis nigoni]